MRYTSKQYAAALLGALEGAPAGRRTDVMRRFFAVLRRHKSMGRLDAIVREVEKISLQKRGVRKVVVESAAPLSEKTKKEIQERVGKKLQFFEKVEPELLAGIRILIDNDTLIDASGKRQVERMFIK